jgi:cell division protease FtsH
MGATYTISILAFKYMINQMKKPPISNTQFKSQKYVGGPTFDDFYGGEEIKEKFREVIDFLHHPEKYEAMGARIRRGIMFYGPPGTGKTLLARALAN